MNYSGGYGNMYFVDDNNGDKYLRVHDGHEEYNDEIWVKLGECSKFSRSYNDNFNTLLVPLYCIDHKSSPVEIVPKKYEYHTKFVFRHQEIVNNSFRELSPEYFV